MSSVTQADTKNIVLVHGLGVDGSSSRSVSRSLTGQGYNVSIVQAPLNCFDNELHFTKLVLNGLVGPMVLVGHSDGGVVITAAENPHVEARIYVAAFQPAPGDSTGSLKAKTPPLLDPTFLRTKLVISSSAMSAFSPDTARGWPADAWRMPRSTADGNCSLARVYLGGVSHVLGLQFPGRSVAEVRALTHVTRQ